MDNTFKRPYPWIAFLGPDGSGKSTIISGLKQKLDEEGVRMTVVHWRPTVRKPLGAPGSVVDVDPHGESSRGFVTSTLALALLVVRWWAGLLLKVRPILSNEGIVLSDRYYMDLLCDFRRYRYGGSLRIAKLAFCLIPKPDCTFFLITDADIIQSRKQEVPRDELERQLDAYQTLCSEMGETAVGLDASKKPEEIVGEVYSHIVKLGRK